MLFLRYIGEKWFPCMYQTYEDQTLPGPNHCMPSAVLKSMIAWTKTQLCRRKPKIKMFY